ncbi:MAG: EthD domain-containing protein [Dehalococcoidia bacterium]
MIKAVALLKRKPGLSMEEFMRHYEETHAPLIISKSVGLEKYARNYVIHNASNPEPDFDCLTELWYSDHDSYKSSMAIRLGEEGRVIEKDEESFLDTRVIRFFLVNEHSARTAGE